MNKQECDICGDIKICLPLEFIVCITDEDGLDQELDNLITCGNCHAQLKKIKEAGESGTNEKTIQDNKPDNTTGNQA